MVINLNQTFWKNNIKKYSSLNHNMYTEILVIGGGLCGVLCAYQLARSGHQVVLVEQNELGCCRTGKTTAVITALQDVYYSDLINSIGEKRTKLFLNANLDAIEDYQKLSEQFDFDFEEVSSYKYSFQTELLHKEILALSKLGYHANLRMNFSFQGQSGEAIEFLNQGQMNPLKLIESLSTYFKVFEHSKVDKIQNHTAYIGKYEIHADKIILTTGYPFFKWQGGFFMKLNQKKSYVLAIRTNQKNKNNAIGGKEKNLYFRSYGDFLLIGGNDTKVGKHQGAFQELDAYVSNYYPNALVEAKWVNQDCVSLDGLPYIGRYRFLKDVYVAAGFNLWGMTGSMIAATLISDMINGKNNPYHELFSIYRSMLVVPLVKNLGTAVINMLSFNKNRCTHMGCALTWNSKEECYECPCHGSKYDADGNIIFNPANKELKHK